MPCPLIGQIAVITDAGMIEQNLTAIRVWRRNHEVILMQPPYRVWDAVRDLISLVGVEDLPRLVWGVECTCTTIRQVA